MVRLDINGVRFSYGSNEALKEVTFSTTTGEILGIIGENGSGKTTLLNCINGEYRPSGGCIMVEGIPPGVIDDCKERMNVRELNDHDRSLVFATVEQNSSAVFPFTVLETVRMGRYSHEDEEEEEENRKIYEAMKRTGTVDLASRKVDELSGGEWRRVMISQALLQEPQVLLLDEPTLHLDIYHQFDLMDLLREINSERKMLIIVVTHDLSLATRYCDKIILMKHGSVIGAGKTSDVITVENIREVFRMDAEVNYDDRLGSLDVKLLGKIRND